MTGKELEVFETKSKILGVGGMKGGMCLSCVLGRHEGAEMDERAVGLGFVMKFSWEENVRKRKCSLRNNQQS